MAFIHFYLSTNQYFDYIYILKNEISIKARHDVQNIGHDNILIQIKNSKYMKIYFLATSEIYCERNKEN